MPKDPITLTAQMGESVDDYKVVNSKRIQLQAKQSIEFEGLILKLESFTFEEIAEVPGNENMPAGSGVVVSIEINDGLNSEGITLNELSKPYESKSFIIWKKYKINLLEVKGDTQASAQLKIELLKR